MIIRGVQALAFSLQMEPRGFAASCDKDYPHKRFKMAQVNHKENIFTKTYRFPGRLQGKSYRTIVAGTQLLLVLNKWMEHGNP